MHVHLCLLRLLLLHLLLVFAPLPLLLLRLLLLHMYALHPYTIRVLARYRIRCWSGAEKCVRGARWGTGLSCRPSICRQPRLLEHIDGLSTKCTTRGRSRGNARQHALWVIQILVLVPVQVVGLVWLGVPWAALRPFEGFLALR